MQSSRRDGIEQSLTFPQYPLLSNEHSLPTCTRDLPRFAAGPRPAPARILKAATDNETLRTGVGRLWIKHGAR
jgi:hypothetical protein